MDDVWTPKIVEEVLVGSARLISITTGRVGPATMKSGMPAYVHEWGDLVDQAAHLNRKLTRIGVTQARMTLAEQALNWLPRYVPRAEHRLALGAYIRSCAVKRPFTKAIRAQGWVKRTAFDWRDAALSQISQGLDRDQVPVSRIFDEVE